jgi:molybdopterin synthase catalytic subunit
VEPPPPVGSDDWVALIAGELPVAPAGAWAVLPSCGAVVSFTGTSRDHSGRPGSGAERTGVTTLQYEAYDEQAVPRLDEAFVAARFCIDAIKATVPIWKREVWPGGSAWGVDAHPVGDAASFDARIGKQA